MTTEDTHPLALWLQAAGKNQSDLARAAGVSRAHISLILKGRRAPSGDVLLRLCEYTRLPFERLRDASTRRAA